MWKCNFKVPPPPPHFKTIWDYKNANASSIQRATGSYNWQYAFEVKPLMKRYKFLLKF